MKKLLTLLVLVGSVAIAAAQGTVNFSNGAAGVNARVTAANGTFASGSGYVADLYYGASAGSLTALGANVGFATGASAGYFFGGQRTLTGFGSGSTVTVQVRAWNTANGATYEQAVANGGETGFSNIFTVSLGGGATPTPSLVGLQSFALQIPEPSTYALGALGIGSLLLMRRRKV